MNDEDKDLYDKLKSVYQSLVSSEEIYPPEAMSPGTYVRANRLNRLGVVLDAFYGDMDKDNKKIVVYTILILPQKHKIRSSLKKESPYYLRNEYEYEVTGFLMMNKIDVSNIMVHLERNL